MTPVAQGGAGTMYYHTGGYHTNYTGFNQFYNGAMGSDHNGTAVYNCYNPAGIPSKLGVCFKQF